MNRETRGAVIMVTHDERLAAAGDRIMLIEDDTMRELSPAEHYASFTAHSR